VVDRGVPHLGRRLRQQQQVLAGPARLAQQHVHLARTGDDRGAVGQQYAEAAVGQHREVDREQTDTGADGGVERAQVFELVRRHRDEPDPVEALPGDLAQRCEPAVEIGAVGRDPVFVQSRRIGPPARGRADLVDRDELPEPGLHERRALRLRHPDGAVEAVGQAHQLGVERGAQRRVLGPGQRDLDVGVDQVEAGADEGGELDPAQQ
jgi:hypothetical protein